MLASPPKLTQLAPPSPYQPPFRAAGEQPKACDKPNTGYSACPHDCPSTCALEIGLLPEGRIGRVRGAPGNSYTAGVICAKVARYAERANHPDRLLHPLLRTGQIGRAHV